MLRLAGETMLDRQIRRLTGVAGRVAVVGLRPEYSTARDILFLPDEPAGRGPLGGIYSGLRQTRTEYNLFLGCDLPFVNHRLLRCLVQRAIATGADGIVPRSLDGRIQPLCAVYRRRARHAIWNALADGENKVTSFFSRVHLVVVPWQEFARARFHPTIFANMNTLEDYEAAKKRLG